jgi:Coenzyme A transferase/FAD dependent oxidoreductase
MRAGGAGIPAFYTPTGYGSAVADGKEVRYFGGQPYLLERAITTDFAFIRGHRADRMGNVQFRGGSRNFNVSFAKAARVTIAEVDEIAETGKIPPGQVDLPGVFVTRVVRSTTQMDWSPTSSSSGRSSCIARTAERAGTHHFPRKKPVVRPQRNPLEWRANLTQLSNPDGSVVDGTNVTELTHGELQGRQQALDAFLFIRDNTPGFGDSYIVDLAPQIGIRETRRIIGTYQLTQDGVRDCADFRTPSG